MSRAALIALAAALISVNAMADDAAPPVTPSGGVGAVDPAPSLNPLATLEKAALEAFRESPLFTPSRRRPVPPPAPVAEAPPPPPPPAEEAPPEPPSIKLSGVVQGPDGAIAFVRNEDDGGRVEQLRLGDQIGGWLVTEIDSGAVKLTLDDREQEYRLFERKEASGGGETEEPDPDEAASRNQRRSRVDPAAGDDNVEEDDPPVRRPQRPRTQNDHNRRSMSPEAQ